MKSTFTRVLLGIVVAQAGLIWYLVSALQKLQGTSLAVPHRSGAPQSAKAAADRPSNQPASAAASARGIAHTSVAERHAQVVFTYGTTEEAGHFVGVTFRRLLEAAEAKEIKDVAKSLKENELDLFSLGPFIKQAEDFEADPARFSEFQAPLLGEVFGFDQARQVELRDLLKQFKAEAASYPLGSEEWTAINHRATSRIVSMLSPDDRQRLKSRIDFISTYGVLVTPTYSVLSSK